MTGWLFFRVFDEATDGFQALVTIEFWGRQGGLAADTTVDPHQLANLLSQLLFRQWARWTALGFRPISHGLCPGR